MGSEPCYQLEIIINYKQYFTILLMFVCSEFSHNVTVTKPSITSSERSNMFIFVLHYRPVPCSSLLVRILQAATHKDGQPKQASEFPEDEWIREGIFVPPPNYTQSNTLVLYYMLYFSLFLCNFSNFSKL